MRRMMNYGELNTRQLGKLKRWRAGDLLEVNRRLHFTIEATATTFRGEYRKVNVPARVIGIKNEGEDYAIPQIAYRHPETDRITCEMGGGVGFTLTQGQFKELKKL